MTLLKEVPFTNEFNQTIYPGDKIIAISEGYQHRIHIRQGIYRGMIGNSVSVETSKAGPWERKRGFIVEPTISTLQKNRIYPLV